MFGSRIKISKEMIGRIKEAVDVAGYSSVEELVENAIDKELERIFSTTQNPSNEKEQIRAKLQGLGYID
jgi:hypothetical protein